MLRRTGRVLRFTLRPLNPGSDVMAAVQILFWLAAPALGALLPFVFVSAWTWTKAALVVAVVFAFLSLRGSYQLLADKELLLADTELRRLLAQQVRVGTELRARLKRRKRGGDLPRKLALEVIEWGSETISKTGRLAPDISDDLFYAHAYVPQSFRRAEHLHYLRRMLGRLARLGRELGRSD